MSTKMVEKSVAVNFILAQTNMNISTMISEMNFVRTRFVTNRNSVGFARKMAQTISFVERGFERLGLGHQAVGYSWCSYMVKLSSPLESFS